MNRANTRSSWVKWLKWIIALLIITGLGVSVMRALQARKVQQEAVAAATATNAKAQAVVELAATDIVQAQVRELSQGLPISGSLKAANSAFIKARVAGELQGLTAREGDSVKVGQVIARIEVTEYAARQQQAQDQADAAKAQIAIAQRQFDNNKALVDQGFISKTALETSLATLHSAQATYRAALSNVDIAKKTILDTVLKSPLSGIVSQRLVQPGERVSVDTRVLEVVDLNQIEMEASVSAADSLRVHIGQQAALNVEGRSGSLNSKVVRINPIAQTGSRNILVYLSLANAPGLRQGLYVQGILNTGSVTGLVVPTNAIRTDKPTPYVQVIEGDQIRHQTVPIGKTGEIIVNTKAIQVTEILPGTITENAQLISGTLGVIREGTRVKITTTAANN